MTVYLAGGVDGTLDCAVRGRIAAPPAIAICHAVCKGLAGVAMGWGRIAFLRLDGDLYESTRDALRALYPLVSPGGAVYVDDYGAFGGCRLAIDEYRQEHRISSPMTKIWQNMTPTTGRFVTPQLRGGYAFEAVWWIKE